MLLDYCYVLYIRLSFICLLPVLVCYIQSFSVVEDVLIRKVVNDMDWFPSVLLPPPPKFLYVTVTPCLNGDNHLHTVNGVLLYSITFSYSHLTL